MFGDPPRVDAGQVRHRLEGFQQGVNNARRMRGRPQENGTAARSGPPAEPERPWDPLFDPLPARRASDPVRPNAAEPPAPPPRSDEVAPAPPQAAGQARDDAAFLAFQQQHLPTVLAALLLEDARPVDAAEVAQAAFDEAYWSWSTLHAPQDWTRARALALLAERRRAGG
jgi:hypothetical protein